MVIEYLIKKFGDEVALSPNRPSAVTDVIAENSKLIQRVIVPKKFRTDVEALESYIDSDLTSGLCITVSLAEIQTVCPRSRHRVDAYDCLVKFLRDEMNVKLTITTSKTKES